VTGREAREIKSGWIDVPYPAEPCGWHEVADAATSSGYTEFQLVERAVSYTTSSRAELQWSASRPADV
jgi:hypothetical protein